MVFIQKLTIDTKLYEVMQTGNSSKNWVGEIFSRETSFILCVVTVKLTNGNLIKTQPVLNR